MAVRMLRRRTMDLPDRPTVVIGQSLLSRNGARQPISGSQQVAGERSQIEQIGLAGLTEVFQINVNLGKSVWRR